jgi:hypothetical protein
MGAPLRIAGQAVCQGRDLCGIRDVEDDRLQILAYELLGVRLSPHPCEDMETARRQSARRGAPDA